MITDVLENFFILAFLVSFRTFLKQFIVARLTILELADEVGIAVENLLSLQDKHLLALAVLLSNIIIDS